MPQSLAGELGELCSPPGSNASVGALPAVVVGLYFSAQWYVELSREKNMTGTIWIKKGER